MQRKSVVDSGVQTYISAIPFIVEDETIVKVQSTRGTQTIAKLIGVSIDIVVTELEYLPFDDIKENCERILDLPKKTVLQFRLPNEMEDESSVHNIDKINSSDPNDIPNTLSKSSDSNEGTALKSIRKDSGASVFHHIAPPKTCVDVAVQTNIGVAPYILDEDEVAQVSTTIAIQTSITFDPTDIGPAVGKRLKTKLSHVHSAIHVIELDKSKPALKLNEAEVKPKKVSLVEIDPLDADLESETKPEVQSKNELSTGIESFTNVTKESIVDIPFDAEILPQEATTTEDAIDLTDDEDTQNLNSTEHQPSEEELTATRTQDYSSQSESAVIANNITSEPMTPSEFEAKIKYVMNSTVVILEAQLDRMIKEYGASAKSEPKLETQNNRSSTMAQTFTTALGEAGCYSGDSNHTTKLPRVQCECQLGRESGGAVPKLRSSGLHFVVNKELPMSNNKVILQATISMPDVKPTNSDLSEPVIRLPMMSSDNTPQQCHCAKSDDKLHENFNHNYRLKLLSPNMANKNCKCGVNDSNSPDVTNLMYEQDGEYADSYLDLLSSQDNEATQTDGCFSIGSPSLDSLSAIKCRCTANIEIPWDKITYKKQNRPIPPVPCPPVPPPEIIIIREEPVIVPVIVPEDKLIQMTVAEMNSAELRELTKKYIGEDLATSNMEIKDIEKQILKLAKEESGGTSREIVEAVGVGTSPILKNDPYADSRRISMVNDSQKYNASPRESFTTRQSDNTSFVQFKFEEPIIKDKQYLKRDDDQLSQRNEIDREASTARESPKRIPESTARELPKQIPESTARELPKQIPESTARELPKRIPEFVFDPSCDRSNEPYMDKMYKFFPDECDDIDICSSHTEIPWNRIILPKNCNIRKVYKPKSKPNIKKINANTSKKNMIIKKLEPFDVQISFAEMTSNIIRVENSAALQQTISTITTLSDICYKPKRATGKNFILNTAASQPFIPGTYNKKLTSGSKTSANSRESTFVGSVNMHNPTQKLSNKSINKPYASMPHISSEPSFKSFARVPVKNNADRIAGLVESCNKEMKPIQDGINKLRNRIRELNIPSISQHQGTRPNYREPKGKVIVPTSSRPYGLPIGSYSSMYRSSPPTNMQYPPYPPLYPFCPYHLPQCFQNPERYGRNNRSNTHRRGKSPSKSSSQGSGLSDFDSPCTCTSQKPNTMPEPTEKKITESAIVTENTPQILKPTCVEKISKRSPKPSKIPIKCPNLKLIISNVESQATSVSIPEEAQIINVCIGTATSKPSSKTVPSDNTICEEPSAQSCEKPEINPDVLESAQPSDNNDAPPGTSTSKKIIVHSKIRMVLPPSAKFQPVTSEKSICTKSSKETCTDEECK